MTIHDNTHQYTTTHDDLCRTTKDLAGLILIWRLQHMRGNRLRALVFKFGELYMSRVYLNNTIMKDLVFASHSTGHMLKTCQNPTLSGSNPHVFLGIANFCNPLLLVARVPMPKNFQNPARWLNNPGWWLSRVRGLSHSQRFFTPVTVTNHRCPFPIGWLINRGV